MDNERATQLLNAERTRVRGLLDELQSESESNREAVNDAGDMSNASESLVAEGLDDLAGEENHAAQTKFLRQ